MQNRLQGGSFWLLARSWLNLRKTPQKNVAFAAANDTNLSTSNCVEKVNTRIKMTKCRISLASSRISIAKCRISSTRCRFPSARCRIDIKKEASGTCQKLIKFKENERTENVTFAAANVTNSSPSNCMENVNTRIQMTKCRISLASSRISIAKCRISSTRYRFPSANYRISVDLIIK